MSQGFGKVREDKREKVREAILSGIPWPLEEGDLDRLLNRIVYIFKEDGNLLKSQNMLILPDEENKTMAKGYQKKVVDG